MRISVSSGRTGTFKGSLECVLETLSNAPLHARNGRETTEILREQRWQGIGEGYVFDLGRFWTVSRRTWCVGRPSTTAFRGHLDDTKRLSIPRDMEGIVPTIMWISNSAVPVQIPTRSGNELVRQDGLVDTVLTSHLPCGSDRKRPRYGTRSSRGRRQEGPASQLGSCGCAAEQAPCARAPEISEMCWTAVI